MITFRLLNLLVATTVLTRQAAGKGILKEWRDAPQYGRQVQLTDKGKAHHILPDDKPIKGELIEYLGNLEWSVNFDNVGIRYVMEKHLEKCPDTSAKPKLEADTLFGINSVIRRLEDVTQEPGKPDPDSEVKKQLRGSFSKHQISVALKKNPGNRNAQFLGAWIYENRDMIAAQPVVTSAAQEHNAYPVTRRRRRARTTPASPARADARDREARAGKSQFKFKQGDKVRTAKGIATVIQVYDVSAWVKNADGSHSGYPLGELEKVG